MRDNYYRLGEGFLIVYSITMRDTFVATNRFYDHILQVKGKDEVPLILVGSKCDLESEREVSRSEGQELSQKWSCPFFETSAKTQVNVQEVFTELVRIVKASKKGEANPSSGNQDGNGCCVLL